MTEETGPRPGGSRRRIAEPRERSISSTTLLAMVVPVLTVGALATVHPSPTEEAGRAPDSAALTRTTLVCPPALPGTEDISVVVAGESGATSGEAGTAGTLRVRGSDEEWSTTPGEAIVLRERRHVVMLGEDGAAPGLVASRAGAGSSAVCTAPWADTWFTGVGAGAERRATLQLVNPDGGPAVADVTVLGEDGPVEVPALRGLTVRGNKMVEIDLASVVPRRDELALRVQVSRGRLASWVLERYDELGGGVSTTDWLPGQAAASTTSYLLGLGGGSGSRTLVVANPGTDEARVDVRVVTARSELTPSGLDQLVVPPGSTAVADLGRVLGGKAGRGAVGLRLDSTHAVGAALRSVTGEDLSHAVTAPPVVARAATALGAGPKRLVLAGVDRVTDVTVVLRDGQGREVGTEQVQVQPGLGVRTSLDSSARFLEVVTDGVPVHAAVESGPPGLAVRPLLELVVDRKVPDVRPALH